MAIIIHHGPNGSYKTSGAIQDHLIDALKKGRVIVTNIRGLTTERVFQVYPDLPSSTEVYNLSMESLDDLQKMRTWFNWVPRGSFLIFDETQLLFPKSWRQSDLDSLAYPGGHEAAAAADRPTSWLDAWTRHRHWNWDIVLTTPNIRYVREDMRETCEMAYLHANLKLIGWGGKYKESMHDAQQNKPNQDGSAIVKVKSIKPKTFALYDSTATGVVTDTSAGTPIWQSPKVVGLLAFLALLIGVAFKDGMPETVSRIASAGEAPEFAGGSPQSPAVVAAAPVVSTARSAAADTSDSVRSMGRTDTEGSSVPVVVEPPPEPWHPFSGYTFFVTGYVESSDKSRQFVMLDAVHTTGRTQPMTARSLREMGYRVDVVSSCLVNLTRGPWSGVAICPGSIPDRERLTLRRHTGDQDGPSFAERRSITTTPEQRAAARARGE